MGKIHDPLEKSGRVNGLKISLAGSTQPLEKNSEEEPIKVMQAQKEERERSSASVKIDPHLITFHDPVSVEAEIFKILRTNILFPKKGRPPRTIMVTSAIPGDGKSFVAANLAISIAQDIDRYVLLVDCDLRRPGVHRQFGFGDVPGLSDYLASGAAISDLLLTTSLNKLSILPAGQKPPNPAELLSSERMKELLTELTNRYRDRLIILDSPPPKLTAEANFLARQVDGILLVVDYGNTKREDADAQYARDQSPINCGDTPWSKTIYATNTGEDETDPNQ